MKKHVALPQDHGSWVFLFSPLLIGLFAAPNKELWPNIVLIATALTAFMARQPVTLIVKILAKRRGRSDLSAAIFWSSLYGLLALLGASYFYFQGFKYILPLAIPGLLVFSWYLWLVARREERHQASIDILASGSLALAAPAAFWINSGQVETLGWALWILTWFQSSASIVYAFLRLGQHKLDKNISKNDKLTLGKRALSYTSFNLILSAFMATRNLFPTFLWVPYLIQWAETLWGIFNPAIGLKPTKVGFRQLGVSTLFTLIFILIW